MTNKTNNKYWLYLENLRKSRVVGVLGSVPYLMKEFGLTDKQATEVLERWMLNYRKEDYE